MTVTNSGNAISGLQCCIGDFNAIANGKEKSGGALVRYNDIKDFKAFISNVGLLDLGFQGPSFTWSNQR